MTQENSLISLHKLVWTSLLAALVAVGAYLHLPLGPVPFSLQVFFVLMAGFILGPRGGALALGLYLLAGLAGLPVFQGGKSGLAHVLGPTGGYLIGFIAAASLAGLGGRERGAPLSWTKGILGGLAGLAGLYLLGLVRLKMVIGADWTKVLSLGFLPFIAGDLVKLVAAVAVQRFLAAKRLLPR